MAEITNLYVLRGNSNFWGYRVFGCYQDRDSAYAAAKLIIDNLSGELYDKLFKNPSDTMAGAVCTDLVINRVYLGDDPYLFEMQDGYWPEEWEAEDVYWNIEEANVE